MPANPPPFCPRYRSTSVFDEGGRAPRRIYHKRPAPIFPDRWYFQYFKDVHVGVTKFADKQRSQSTDIFQQHILKM